MDTMSTRSTDAQAVLRTQRIELPSWAFGNSGTRFKVFAQQGVPRDPFEKIADAAQVHRYTGVAPTVALHIPWDKVDDFGELARPRPRARRRPRDDQLQHVPGQRLHARQRLPSGRARPAQGRRSSARVHRHHGRHRVARPQAVVRGRDELPGPGRHPRPPGPPGRVARAPSTTGWGRTSGWCSSTSCSSRRSTRWTCRTGARRSSTASHWARRQGRRGHRPPRAGDEHRVHRRGAAARWTSSAGSTSTRGSTRTTT